ncbi:mannosyltransferase family protein [Streptomyces sp. NPDC097941]|uniref:mannosyltransferase family protein n=1 Tax=Streptomyces sp. NPDC097941 TaxID=3155685 RepID=UPI0033193939
MTNLGTRTEPALRRAAPALLGYAAVRALGLLTLALWSGARDKSAYTLLTARWDALWYTRVAELGYGYEVRLPNGDVHSNLAFFPLLPWLERLLSAVAPLSYADAGFAVALLASLAAAWGVFAVTDLVYGRRAGVCAVLLWAVLPVGIVQSMAYSESLFTALAAWSLYAVLTGRWVTAGLLASLAGLTRPVGLAVVAAVWVAGIAAHLGDRRNRTRAQGASGITAPALRGPASTPRRGAAEHTRHFTGHLKLDEGSAPNVAETDPAAPGTGPRGNSPSASGADTPRTDPATPGASSSLDTPGPPERTPVLQAPGNPADSSFERGRSAAGASGAPDAEYAPTDRTPSSTTERIADADSAPDPTHAPAVGPPHTPDPGPSPSASGSDPAVPSGAGSSPAPGSAHTPRPGPATAPADHPAPRRALGMALAPLGAAAYVLWVGHRTGKGPLGYLDVQAGWRNGFDGGYAFARFVADKFTSFPSALAGTGLIVGVGLVVWLYVVCARQGQPLPLLVYSGVVTALALCASSYFGSKPRLLMPAFPLLLPLALALARSRTRRSAVIITLIATASALYGAFWLNGSGPP